MNANRIPGRDEDALRDVAALLKHAGASVQPEEALVLQRIAQQRQRLRLHAAQAAPRQAQAARTRLAAGAAAALDAEPAPPRHWARAAAHTVGANPLWLAGRDFALRHPISVGLALGSGLVLGPRKLLRSLLWMGPLVWRGWRMVERMERPLRAISRWR
ncbi:hypothetical protein CK623_11690 [Vandammella animalimorsus]|uniref:Uncharacterized protein n=1 Tax=Vandammella animalimorsus TaxID=2029117 RepID=A0A2A2AN10_9BURK|nr:hypothetical protein [Vandammella animalimorsus]PAT39111.1 hypothetical protein CK623_11690 [Vandammella animalimorsus]